MMTTNEAAAKMIRQRALSLAFNIGELPTSVNELAGLLEGFALGVRNDITDESLQGYLSVQPVEPVAQPNGAKLMRKGKLTTFATTVLENGKCKVEFGTGRIHGDSKTDPYNLPAFFTKNKRGLDRQWMHLMQAFTPETTMSQAVNILSEQGAKVHSYCAMD